MSPKGIRTERTNKKKMTGKTTTVATRTLDQQNITPEEAAPRKIARKPRKSRRSAQYTVELNEEKKAEGYYDAKIGETLNKCYKIQKTLGSGAYASVHQARVRKTKTTEGKTVALKIVRCEERYAESSKKEIDLLRQIKEDSERFSSDPGSKNIVSLLDSFDHKTKNDDIHVVMVLEMLGPDLYSILRKSNYRFLTPNRIRRFSEDILKGLDFLHSKCDIMHLDLKPENLLVTVDPKNWNLMDSRCSASIKIGDFGLSHYCTETVKRTVQTCHYRAPEAFLKAQITPAADIWSFGCTLYEMAKNRVLFMCNDPDNCDNKWHLERISELLGPIEKRYFMENKNNKAIFEKVFGGKDHIKKESGVANRICPEELGRGHLMMTEREARMLSEFLRKILKIAPEERLTAKKALEDPFLVKDTCSQIMSFRVFS